jgi:hypothetical protein
MVNLPTTTFYWRPLGAAADAWTEASTGAFTPSPGAGVEVVSVGPSRARAIVADTAPALVAPIGVQNFNAGAGGVLDVSGAFSGTNLRFALSGAPAWASINPLTGIITAAAPALTGAAGTWTVTARNSAGAPVQAGFPANVVSGAPQTVVWALIGQSNMVGRAAYDGAGTHPAGTLQWGRNAPNDGVLIAATHPLQHWDPSGTNMGPDIGFADAWTAAHPGDTLVFMPGADGGTGFSDMMWRVGDPLYVDAVARVNALFAANPGFVFGGFLWHQGEKDTGQTAAFYQAHLDAMIEGLRNDVTVAGPTTPFVLGQMVEAYYVGNAGREAIQAVIDDTPSRIAYTAVASSAGLVDKGDALHFDGPSQRILGGRYHDAAHVAAGNVAAAPGQVAGLSAVASDGQVALSWTAPATGGSPITDYVIERQIGGGAFAVVADGVNTGTTFVDTGRTNGVAHGYRVSAVNAVGTGTASAVASATPVAAATAPAQVMGLSAVAGDGQVTLSWTAPATGGSPITDYVIERQIGGGAFAVVADGVNTGTTFVDTGRTNGVLHGYRIGAVNAVGTGVASSVATATPAAAVQQLVAVNTFASASDPGSASTYTFSGVQIGAGTVFVGVTRRRRQHVQRGRHVADRRRGGDHADRRAAASDPDRPVPFDAPVERRIGRDGDSDSDACQFRQPLRHRGLDPRQRRNRGVLERLARRQRGDLRHRERAGQGRAAGPWHDHRRGPGAFLHLGRGPAPGAAVGGCVVLRPGRRPCLWGGADRRVGGAVRRVGDEHDPLRAGCQSRLRRDGPNCNDGVRFGGRRHHAARRRGGANKLLSIFAGLLPCHAFNAISVANDPATAGDSNHGKARLPRNRGDEMRNLDDLRLSRRPPGGIHGAKCWSEFFQLR